MPASLGLVCNLFQEANALPGFLEMAFSAGFDDILFYHAGPGGKHSTDGTIEMIQKWGARLEFGSIDEGFGVVRTKALHLSTCDWVMILDADERFHRIAPLINCDDSLKTAMVGQPYNQMRWLRDDLLTSADIDAVRTSRRHWHDFSWSKPCQNWEKIPDWQLRIVRNAPYIEYDSKVKMHEQLLDTRMNRTPRHLQLHEPQGPWHDHYHCWWKSRFEPEQRAHDVRIYDALHEGRPVPQE